MDGLISGRTLADADAAESVPPAELMHEIVEQLSLGTLVFDRQLRVLLCNKRARCLLGLGKTLHGASLRDLLPASLIAACDQALSRAEEQDATRISLPDGRALRLRTRPLGAECWVATLDEMQHDEGSAPADVDPVTGLEPQRRFNDCLSGMIAPGTALVMLDLDRFKVVNDTLGHAAGDALLQLVGKRIKGAVRGEDRAFRLGGDEFALVLHDGAGAHTLAHRIVDLVGRPYLIQGSTANIGVSAGIAHVPSDGETPEALVRSADMALNAAKADGRGTVRGFRAEMAERAKARNALERDLRAAIPLGHLELFYQPQANLRTRALVGFEALLRWRHPARGLISPGDFIPVAEETRLIVPIGEWALRAACRDAQGWPMPLPVAVNVSAIQLAEHARLCRAGEGALKTSGLDPARLELEITESALVRDPAAALATLRTLRDLGVRIAMDDFGTGYSSLSQLRSFPFNKLKIDRSFVHDLGDSDEAVAVVRAIAALGTSLGMRTTAEGVETGEQAERVMAEGCTDMQGYLLSRPRPASEISALILRHKAQS